MQPLVLIEGCMVVTVVFAEFNLLRKLINEENIIIVGSCSEFTQILMLVSIYTFLVKPCGYFTVDTDAMITFT